MVLDAILISGKNQEKKCFSAEGSEIIVQILNILYKESKNYAPLPFKEWKTKVHQGMGRKENRQGCLTEYGFKYEVRWK